MYKRNFRKTPKTSSNVPLPVVLSQKPLETQAQRPDKENENENEEAVPSSQNIEEQVVLASQPSTLHTQSRFLSQRQISRFTQDAHDRGKNYFEIALLSCKIKITEFSE